MPEDPESVAGDIEPPRYARRSSVRVEHALVGSLWLAYIPVAFLLLAALGAFVYGVAVFVNVFSSIVQHPFPVGHHIGLFLLDFDLFLIGATALISAIGFYELFIADINRRQAGLLPRWLAMKDLNDLKARVVSMVVLVLAVVFAEEAVDSPDGLYLLEFGGAITLVIVALTVFVRLSGHRDNWNLKPRQRAGGPVSGAGRWRPVSWGSGWAGRRPAATGRPRGPTRRRRCCAAHGTPRPGAPGRSSGREPQLPRPPR